MEKGEVEHDICLGIPLNGYENVDGRVRSNEFSKALFIPLLMTLPLLGPPPGS